MKYRNLCGNKVSLLGLGCMRFPMKDSKIIEFTSMEIAEEAYKNGINYFDTAYVYSNGESEKFVSKIIKKIGRENIYIATKLPLFKYASKEQFNNFLNEQLNNLDIECIDYYLFHALNKERFENMQKEDYKKFIEASKQDNKIKHIGFSFHDDYETFVKIIDDYDWEFCQLQFNYVDAYEQNALKMYEYAKRKNVEVIIMEPLRGGRLSHVPKEVRKCLDTSFTKTDADISFKYIADFVNNKVILSGMRSIEDIIRNVNSFDSFEPESLTEKEKECYKEAYEIFRKYQIINCTKCEYCKDKCPKNIHISQIFEKYNFLIENPYLNEDEFQKWYDDLQSKASDCIACGMCEKACPQHLEIINLLKKCDEYFKKTT